MGNEVRSIPEAIRDAADNISALRGTSAAHTFPTEAVGSDGLTAGTAEEVLAQLQRISDLVDEILQAAPNKLNAVADDLEQTDNAAAGQFK